jgi:pantoate--beta-alanine ligase
VLFNEFSGRTDETPAPATPTSRLCDGGKEIAMPGSLAEMRVARSVAELRKAIARWRGEGARIGLVPTMGAIHAGHLALVSAGRGACERVVATLFVNPKQFGPQEDFAAYPRDEAADFDAFRQAGVDLVFAPPVEEMYAPGFVTNIQIGGIADQLEGARRPGHFDGVATVVTKLLLQALPDIACFGEKDYQQLMIVRRLVRDLNIPVRIEGVSTVREPDGLALSSRNVYLSRAERQAAPALYRTLSDTAAALAGAPDRVTEALARGVAMLRGAGFEPDYLELRDAKTLAPMAALDRAARLLAAARLGRTRLIDNIAVIPK